MSKTVGKSVKVQKWGAPTAISARNFNRPHHEAQFIRMADHTKKQDILSITKNNKVSDIPVNNEGKAFRLSSFISPVFKLPYTIGKQLITYIVNLINKSTSPFAKQEQPSLEEAVFYLNDSVGYHWRPFSTQFAQPPGQSAIYNKKASKTNEIANTVKQTIQTISEDNLEIDKTDDGSINGLDDIYPENTIHTIFCETDTDLPRVERLHKERNIDERISIYKEALIESAPPRKINPEYRNSKFDFSSMPRVKSRVEEMNKTAKEALVKESGMVPISQMSELFKQASEQKADIQESLGKSGIPFSRKRHASAPMHHYPAQNPGVAYAAGIDEATSGILLESLAKTNKSLSKNIDNIVSDYFAQG